LILLGEIVYSRRDVRNRFYSPDKFNSDGRRKKESQGMPVSLEERKSGWWFKRSGFSTSKNW